MGKFDFEGPQDYKTKFLADLSRLKEYAEKDDDWVSMFGHAARSLGLTEVVRHTDSSLNDITGLGIKPREGDLLLFSGFDQAVRQGAVWAVPLAKLQEATPETLRELALLFWLCLPDSPRIQVGFFGDLANYCSEWGCWFDQETPDDLDIP